MNFRQVQKAPKALAFFQYRGQKHICGLNITLATCAQQSSLVQGATFFSVRNIIFAVK